MEDTQKAATTPDGFMHELSERLSELSTLGVANRAGANRKNYPPESSLVKALEEARVIPPDLAARLYDAIPLLTRAIVGKAEFAREASMWTEANGPEVITELTNVYRRARSGRIGSRPPT
jgi:hypothetical protein